MHTKKSYEIVFVMLLLLAAFNSNAQVTLLNKPDISVTQAPAPAVSVTTPGAYPAGTTYNYVRSWQAMGPFTDVTSFTNQPYNAVKQATSYIDGLGRPIQTVMKESTPGNSPKDVVSPVIYDAYGREAIKYMPYVAPTSDGNFKSDPFNQQQTYLQSIYTGEQVFYSKTDFDASPLNRPAKAYAQGNSWAGSNKGTEQQYLTNTLANDVKIWSIEYDLNNFDNNVPVNATNPYDVGQLYQNKTIDENLNAVVEFKDKEGKVILKKVQVGRTVNEAYTGWLCTYYVYDDFGKLRFVIPPKAVAWLPAHGWSFAGTEGNGVANELCFRYEYDKLNRMIAKKVPGADWTYMVYDRRDRLVFMQDANMRTNNQWLATVYDGLNRQVLTGIITFIGNQAALQASVDANAGLNPAGITVSRTPPEIVTGDITVNTLQSNNRHYKASNSITMEAGFDTDNSSDVLLEIQPGGTTPVDETISVNDNPIMASYNYIALTETYYDNYTFNTSPVLNYSAPSTPLNAGSALYPVTTPTEAQQAKVPTRGMVTCTRVRTLPDPSNLAAGFWLSNIIFYDDRGRVLQTYADNYKGGVDKATNLYNFTGAVLCSRLEHNNPQNADVALQQITVQTNLNYDHAGRLLQVSKSVNGAVAKIISNNTYDALGQLTTKELGRMADNSGPVETLDYTYNVRGWLKGINKDYGVTSSNTSRWFGMELNYDWGFATNQLNGNIGGTKWRSKGDGEQRSYGYKYDKVNRLLSADFAQGTTYLDDAVVNFDMNMGSFAGGNYEEGSAYDENGNILAMTQYGLKFNASAAIDNLTYTYSVNSNKLKNVIEAPGVNDPLTKLGDFRISQNYLTALGNPFTKPATAIDYTYDQNGNLIQDINKDIDISAGAIQGIQYNHLNLPWKINVKNKGSITYIYDAVGNKLEKKTDDITTPPPGGTSGSKTTNYLTGFVYENNVLQFFGHEEGRVRVVPSTTGGASTFVFDYFVKDHLGNVRMVLTDEQQTDIYPAVSFEDANLPAEQLYYENVDVQKTTRPGAFYTNTTNGNQVQLLRKTTNAIGAGKLLKVMATDKIEVKVDYYIPSATTDNSGANGLNSLLASLLNILNGVGAPAALKGNGGLITDNLNSSGPFTDYLQPQNATEPSSQPKAYLNILFFDEQFKFLQQNSQLVQVNIQGSPQQIVKINTDAAEAVKNGYVYIYVSNESNNLVYFDNLAVTQVRGALLEETHYYPFGLTMAGISSKAAGKIQNKEKTFQGQQFDDDLGINYVEFKFRNHDPQNGRFIEIDPLTEKYVYNSTYAFSENKITAHVELEGLESVLAASVFNHHQNKEISSITLNRDALLTSTSLSSIQNNGKLLSSNTIIRLFQKEFFHLPTNINSVQEIVTHTSSKIENLKNIGKVVVTRGETTTTTVKLNMFEESGIETITKTTSSTVGYSKIVSDDPQNNEITVSVLPLDNLQSSNPKVEEVKLSEKLSDNIKNLSPELSKSVDSAVEINASVKAEGIKALDGKKFK